MVQAYAARAGLDPTAFAGHSLRSGFVTSAAANGRTTATIASHTGHRSEAVLRGYIRPVTAFDSHPGEGLL